MNNVSYSTLLISTVMSFWNLLMYNAVCSTTRYVILPINTLKLTTALWYPHAVKHSVSSPHSPLDSASRELHMWPKVTFNSFIFIGFYPRILFDDCSGIFDISSRPSWYTATQIFYCCCVCWLIFSDRRAHFTNGFSDNYDSSENHVQNVVTRCWGAEILKYMIYILPVENL